MHLRRPLTVLAVAAALLLAPRARADLTVQLGNGDRVSGAFLPAGEVETFTAFIPGGATVTATAKGKKVKGKPTPVVSISLFDPDGSEVGQDETVTLPTGERIANFGVEVTGLHTFRLVSTEAGDYTFSAKWRVPPVTRETLFLGGAGDLQTVSFAADVGSSVTVSAKRARGSQALPRILGIDAEDFSWSSDPIDPPANPNATSQTVRGVRIGGAGGAYAVSIADDSIEGGDVAVTVVVTPPKQKPRKVDLGLKQTGSDPVNQYGKGAIFGPDGGDLLLEEEGTSILDGTSISIPPGALANPTVILVTTAPPVVPPGGNSQPGGPAVNFGPDGLQFREGDGGEQVFITIPFDAEAFGDDPDAVEVYVRDSKGKVSLVTPKSSYVIDTVAGTVTFPVSHFSSYQVFVPRRPRPADLNADGFDDLVVPAPHAGSDQGKVLVFYGRRDFTTKPPTQADLVIDGPDGEVGFGYAVAVGDVNGDGIADLVASSFDLTTSDVGRVRVLFGGTTFGQAGDAADVVIDGAVAVGASFGECVAVGDVTGDGAGDVIVGAPDASPIDTAEGSVFVFPGGVAIASTASDAPGVIRINGDFMNTRLGRSLATGRLVGDASLDLVIGAEGGPTGADSGSVFLVPGGTALQSGLAGLLGVDYSGDLPGDRFGMSVAVADVDADGSDDLVVGAPGVDVFSLELGTLVDAGAVYTFLGPDFDGGGPAGADETLDAFPQAGEARGAAVRAGNFIGNSVRDVAFGTPMRDADQAPPADRGGVGLVRGGFDFPAGSQIVSSGDASDMLGRYLMPIADLNGDGRHDLAAAAPGASGGRGRVTVYLSNGLAGTTVTITGDLGFRLGGP
jgi:hypothetical protein